VHRLNGSRDRRGTARQDPTTPLPLETSQAHRLLCGFSGDGFNDFLQDAARDWPNFGNEFPEAICRHWCSRCVAGQIIERSLQCVLFFSTQLVKVIGVFFRSGQSRFCPREGRAAFPENFGGL
jgi:hypothetical protein